jgi:hypothetical protein
VFFILISIEREQQKFSEVPLVFVHKSVPVENGEPINESESEKTAEMPG